ncbi:hypothetical protein L0F63_004414 [Massospora cicadina]|nr:hypothetical protein L0F63_004414 [Massospora cicadina]
MSYPTDFMCEPNLKLEAYPDLMPYYTMPLPTTDFNFPQGEDTKCHPIQGALDVNANNQLEFAQDKYAYYPYCGPSDVTSSSIHSGVELAPYRPNSVPQFRKKGTLPKRQPHTSASLPSVHITSTGKRCTNCRCEETPSWRRCQNGINLLCNACGLYEKLHCRPRPIFIDKDGYIKVVRDRRPRSAHPNHP